MLFYITLSSPNPTLTFLIYPITLILSYLQLSYAILTDPIRCFHIQSHLILLHPILSYLSSFHPILSHKYFSCPNPICVLFFGTISIKNECLYGEVSSTTPYFLFSVLFSYLFYFLFAIYLNFSHFFTEVFTVAKNTIVATLREYLCMHKNMDNNK